MLFFLLFSSRSVTVGRGVVADVYLLLQRLPGPPLSKDSEISLLVKNNVTVGIGCEGSWAARNARFDVGWVRSTFFCLKYFPKANVLSKM